MQVIVTDIRPSFSYFLGELTFKKFYRLKDKIKKIFGTIYKFRIFTVLTFDNLILVIICFFRKILYKEC
jgi:hypothetical protein